MSNTLQENFWQSEFGRDYTDRNDYHTQDTLNDFYMKNWGISADEMAKGFLDGLEIDSVLEVGCNTGNQLAHLQRLGFKNLYGFDIMPYAIEEAKEKTKGINCIEGSAFDNPFKDEFFDLVFTSGVLIHISPDDVVRAMDEMHRTSRRYIWGFEYFSEKCEEINYRGNDDRLWKANFAQMFLDRFDDLVLVKEERYKYVDSDNVDTMYLLEKKK